MIVMKIRFRNDDEDVELVGVREVKFKDGMTKWTYLKHGELKTKEFEIKHISHITFGASY